MNFLITSADPTTPMLNALCLLPCHLDLALRELDDLVAALRVRQVRLAGVQPSVLKLDAADVKVGLDLDPAVARCGDLGRELINQSY